MSGSTDINGLPYPTLADPPNIEDAVKPLAEEVDTRIVPRFSTTTERDGAIAAPIDGQVCHVATHGLMVYSGGWCPLPGTLVLKLLRTTTVTLSDNIATALAWDTEELDLLGGWSSGTATRFTPPVAGWYELTGGSAWNTNSSGHRALYWRLNGATTINGGAIYVAPSPNSSTVVSAKTLPVQLNGTDYVELMTLQASGGSLASSHSAATTYSFMAAKFLSP